MATVPENLNKILQARYGEEVRGAIYDSIAQCYKDSTGESLDSLEQRAVANPVVNGGYIEYNADLEPPYDDLNTFEANTIIFNDNKNLKNLPKNDTCYILTYGNIHSNNAMKLQIVIYYDDTIYTRHIHGGSYAQWTEWKNITSIASTALSRVSSLEQRAVANPVVNGGYIEYNADLEPPYDDLNTFEANTIIFNDNKNLKNLPKNDTCYILTYGNIHSNNAMKLQIVIYYDDTIYTRHIHGGSYAQWTEWKNITSVSSNSYVNFGIFSSMACMGDSFTQGGMASSDGHWISDEESRRNSWPSIIAKRDFITVKNFAKGGHMVKDAYESVLSSVLGDETYDAYTYCWGINDSGDTPALNGRWDGLNPEQRLGSSEDIVSGLEEPNHTFYGYYSSIIRKIQNHAPKARHLIIVSPPESEQKYRQMYKDATIDIAKKMGIPYINPIDDPFFKSNTYKAMNLGHPTRQGYLGMAIAYERLFSVCVENNSQYFKKTVIG